MACCAHNADISRFDPDPRNRSAQGVGRPHKAAREGSRSLRCDNTARLPGGSSSLTRNSARFDSVASHGSVNELRTVPLAAGTLAECFARLAVW